MRWVAPNLVVADLDASMAFYASVLGFEEWFRWAPPGGGPRAAGVVAGNARFILDEGKVPPAAGAGVDSYLDVGDQDIDALYERARRSAAVLEEIGDRPWGDRTFAIADPDGYRLRIAKTIGGGT